MTAKDVINSFGYAVCQGENGKKYVAISTRAIQNDATKAANQYFKAKNTLLLTEKGYLTDKDELFVGDFYRGNENYTNVWVVSVGK